MTDSTATPRQPSIPAIETKYAGCRFRSRLEARWAVFFDALSIQWEYEPQGFENYYGDRYLPDFFLPEMHAWNTGRDPGAKGIYVEVKGSDEQVDGDYRTLLANMVDYHGPMQQGLLLLGPVPRVDGVSGVSHPLLAWHKGVQHHAVEFMPTWDGAALRESRFSDFSGYDGDNTSEGLSFHLSWDAESYVLSNGRGTWQMPAAIAAAYTAARSARFEHGEQG